MNIWAQFYIDNRPVCGSDGVMPIDRRLGWYRRSEKIREEAQKRGYNGYSLIRGNLLNGFETGIIPIV